MYNFFNSCIDQESEDYPIAKTTKGKKHTDAGVPSGGRGSRGGSRIALEGGGAAEEDEAGANVAGGAFLPDGGDCGEGMAAAGARAVFGLLDDRVDDGVSGGGAGPGGGGLVGRWWRGIGVGVVVRSVIRIGFGRHGKRGIHVHEVGREDL